MGVILFNGKQVISHTYRVEQKEAFAHVFAKCKEASLIE
jgi:hypothetical protein